jgi:hypothetical protein
MDFKFEKRKTKKDKEHKNREINGKFSAKHVRIQEKCQENHIKNLQEERLNKNKGKNNDKNKGKK